MFDEYLGGLVNIEGLSHLLVSSYLSELTKEERRRKMRRKVKPEWLKVRWGSGVS